MYINFIDYDNFIDNTLREIIHTHSVLAMIVIVEKRFILRYVFFKLLLKYLISLYKNVIFINNILTEMENVS